MGGHSRWSLARREGGGAEGERCVDETATSRCRREVYLLNVGKCVKSGNLGKEQGRQRHPRRRRLPEIIPRNFRCIPCPPSAMLNAPSNSAHRRSSSVPAPLGLDTQPRRSHSHSASHPLNSPLPSTTNLNAVHGLPADAAQFLISSLFAHFVKLAELKINHLLFVSLVQISFLLPLLIACTPELHLLLP